jgi:putative salt-induced outer membrane protein YdiY
MKRLSYSLAMLASAGLVINGSIQAEEAPGAAVATPPPAPPKTWESSASLNLTATSGNSESLLFGGSILAKKKWSRNELNLGADLTYGQTTTENVAGGQLIKTKSTSAQNYGAFLQYNRLVWEDRGYFLGRADGRQDKVADVIYRFTLSPGAGYYFIRDKSLELSGEAGPGIAFEKLKGATETDYFTVRLAEKLKWIINERSRLYQDLEYLPRVDNFNDFVVNASIKVETDITKSLALGVTLQDTYRSEPALIPGTMPALHRKKNDLKILAGVTYKF